MILKSTMIIVTDINKSVEFYKKILELNVIMDFGANKTLTRKFSFTDNRNI